MENNGFLWTEPVSMYNVTATYFAYLVKLGSTYLLKVA